MNKIFYKSSQNMNEVSDCSVDLIITSPPYFNIKDYAKNGYQNYIHSYSKKEDEEFPSVQGLASVLQNRHYEALRMWDL